MSSTLTDVCRVAGVSSATVSRVINGSDKVTEATRERVEKAMAELNYHPSFSAQSLARKRTNTIGVIFPRIASGYYLELLEGIDEGATRRNFHLMVSFAHNREEEEFQIKDFIFGRKVDGVLIVNLDIDHALVGDVIERGVPLVLISRPSLNQKSLSVTQDNQGGGASAFRHLIQQGYKDILVVTGSENTYDSDERLRGCNAVASTEGAVIAQDRILHGEFTFESGYNVMEKFLRENKKLPEAIFAFNDNMALGILSLFKEKGIRVPEEVAIIGYDDCETAQYAGLTSVRAPAKEMGHKAFDVLLRSVLKENEKADPVSYVLPTELVVRASSGGKA